MWIGAQTLCRDSVVEPPTTDKGWNMKEGRRSETPLPDHLPFIRGCLFGLWSQKTPPEQIYRERSGMRVSKTKLSVFHTVSVDV